MATRAVTVFAACSALAFATFACSLGALDGFSGGETLATDGGGDAGGRSSSGDATPAADGSGGDASAATGFCAKLTTPFTSCVDFDDGKLPAMFNPEISGGAEVAVDTGGKDGTSGLVVRVPAGASDNASACISLLVDGPRTGLVLEADVRFDALGSNNYDVFNFDDGQPELGISVTGTAFYIEEDAVSDGGEVDLSAKTSATAKSAWQHFRFVVTVSGTVAKTELFVGALRRRRQSRNERCGRFHDLGIDEVRGRRLLARRRGQLDRALRQRRLDRDEVNQSSLIE
jgi:hypothetical protein